MQSKFNATFKRRKEISTVKEAVNKVLADLIRTQELEKELVSNTEYILWLENFTSTHTYWSDDTWLYCPEKISKEDYKRVEELHCFFNGIVDYAERNFIPTYNDEYGYDTYIFIQFNNVGYRIGEMIGQGTLAYCERVDISSDNVFIDFNDIIINKKQENVDDIEKKLDSMCKIIEELISMGVPAKSISKRVQNALDEE